MLYSRIPKLGPQVSLVALHRHRGIVPQTAGPDEDYLWGRAAAYWAMVKMGVRIPAPIPRGNEGNPLWPRNLVGSVTHSGGLAIAAVASNSDIRSLGIDYQSFRPVPERVRERVLHWHEQQWCESDPAQVERRSLLAFSAKESVFKALFPLVQKRFWFSAVELDWDDSMQGFRGRLLERLSDEFASGFCFEVPSLLLAEGVFTSVVLEQPSH